MNIDDPTQLNRLHKAVESSYRSLEPFRKLARTLVEDYAGSAYGPSSFSAHGGPKYLTLINLMKQMVDAYQMSLVANRPRIMLSTARQDADAKFFCQVFEVAVNNLIKEIGLEITLKEWVLDAIFGLGVIKVHMADAGQVELEDDIWMDPGKPFASNVSLDNFVFDLGATKWSRVRFAGDCYRLPLEDLQDATIYDQEAVKSISASSKFGMDSDRMEQISRGQEVDQDELEPMVDLLDLWIARDQMIYTFVLDRNSKLFSPNGPPVAKMRWDGSEHGPYHLLGFNDVPENIMPTSLAADLAELSRLINAIMRKQSRRARNQKKLHTFTPAGQEAMSKMIRAGDDQAIEVQDTKDVGKVEMGGVDAANAQFMTECMTLFDRLAGNLTALLGLGAQADTVGQEQLIHGSVSKKVAAMQTRVVEATGRLCKDLGYLLWHDKYKTMAGEIAIEGAEGYVLPAEWSPDYRVGKFPDYMFEVDAYSLPYQSPGQKAQALTQLLTTLYIPGTPLMMQQGGSLDWSELTDQLAELFNMPRLREIIKFQGMPPQQGMQEEQPAEPGMAPTTTRNYNRHSSSGGAAAQQAGGVGPWAQIMNMQAQASANSGG